jgi:very-short-patch-repair endonuclease
MSIEHEPMAHGGLVATHELHTRGFDRAAIASAVRTGRIRRVRQGWYSSVYLAPTFARAARVGGVATCVTALAAAGVWVLDSELELHVAVKPTACQLRSPRDSRERLGTQDVVIHWTLADHVNRLTRSLSDSLIDYAGCATPELLAATANSLLREHPEYRAEWQSLRTRFPQRTQRLLSFVDGVCESGTEFVFWVRLRRLHVRMRRQVWIEGVGRVDFLIGERLVIEINGFEHHGGREQYEADHRREAFLGAIGHRGLRFSHKQVFEQWDTVEAAVYAAVARGDHL